MAGKYEERFDELGENGPPSPTYTHEEHIRRFYREADAEIADLRKKCDKLAGAGWVSVEDRLPEGGVSCIVTNAKPKTYGYGECIVGCVYREDLFYACESEHEILRDVTHWMPKPDPVQIAREVKG